LGAAQDWPLLQFGYLSADDEHRPIRSRSRRGSGFGRGRFGKDNVVLLARSWGTVLGTIYAAHHPEKISAYVAIAQITDVPRGRKLSYDFALSEALNHSDETAVSELMAIGPPPYNSVNERLTTAKWVEHFGGVFRADLSTAKLIWAALGAEEANLFDLVKFGRGNRFSLVHFEDEFSRLSLRQNYRRFEVPVFFLLGRYDQHVPAILAEQYFQEIEAPTNRLVWFEHSAHNPPFEEPGKFNRLLIEHVLPFAQGR
jgi:proline iminopeptidase